jgi:hypothetical protein
VRASWRGVGDGKAEGGSGGAVSGGVVLVAVVIGVDSAVVGDFRGGGGVGEVVGVGCGYCVGGDAVAGGGEVRLPLNVGDVFFMLRSGGDLHGLGEVLPQSEVEVADLELLGEFERDIAVHIAL